MNARVARVGMMLALLAVSLAGCGVRGALDSPTAGDQSQRRNGTLTAPSKAGEAPAKPPHRDFLLDGLIR